MKQSVTVEYHKKLQDLVDKWRDIVGVDRVYIIEIIESTNNSNPAWLEGLDLDNPHPVVHLFINAEWIQKHRNNDKEVLSTIVHELVHIVVWEHLIQVDPNYTYTGLKARANEMLTMKMTNAIIHSYYEQHAK